MGFQVGQALYQSLGLPLPNAPAKTPFPILIYVSSFSISTSDVIESTELNYPPGRQHRNGHSSNPICKTVRKVPPHPPPTTPQLTSNPQLRSPSPNNLLPPQHHPLPQLGRRQSLRLQLPHLRRRHPRLHIQQAAPRPGYHSRELQPDHLLRSAVLGYRDDGKCLFVAVAGAGAAQSRCEEFAYHGVHGAWRGV